MDIANAFILVGSILGVIVIGAMAILPSVWELDAARADRPRRRHRSTAASPSSRAASSAHTLTGPAPAVPARVDRMRSVHNRASTAEPAALRPVRPVADPAPVAPRTRTQAAGARTPQGLDRAA